MMKCLRLEFDQWIGQVGQGSYSGNASRHWQRRLVFGLMPNIESCMHCPTGTEETDGVWSGRPTMTPKGIISSQFEATRFSSDQQTIRELSVIPMSIFEKYKDAEPYFDQAP
ncbi:hypothetical protein V6Z88_006674 [Aspergillus fumigatus]